ncbi:hypothetical protein MKJ01_10055 [Chryseobacterium sp. SSA4.19]|uniref:hypothetical protein n=1 Tax=Chryseobacterium sp. SSA4.19 TaxID=2919915 RepID=UPI001F4D618F|nr:hypothetical protein [Chryseobacterium sp. SSA4.19]MCJ8154101.1 hypothetical protein [Chryseobacterium sp. SSA4.19]
MIKIFLIILAIYLLYYAGNIVYDLFLKKDGLAKQSESEEYALTAFAEENTNQIKAVSIDDVEHLNTPASFNKKELFSTTDEEFDEPHDLEHWRQKFEFEQDIDAFETRPENNRHSTEINELKEYHSVEQENIHGDEIKELSAAPSEKEDNVQSKHKKEDPALKLKQQFNQFLNLAETQVQVLSDRDGFKVYHSMI